MTNPSGDAHEDAVAQLMAERDRIQAWIAALDARRAVTPPHIFERVRGDYELRLRQTLDQLLNHREALQTKADDLIKRLTTLDGEESRRRDEVAEFELRAAVGEIDPDQWSKMAGET